MTSTVTFISKEQKKKTNVKKPAPPLLIPLPEDIFYPFVTSGAERAGGGPGTVLLAVLCSLLAMVAAALLRQ